MVSVARAEAGKEEVRNFAPRVHTEPHLRVLNFSAQVQRGILKSYNCHEAILCTIDQRKEKDAFWRKPEYNLPGGLWSLRLTGKREGTQGPAVTTAELGRSSAHNYSNVPKAREVWRNKGDMSESYS